MFLAIGVSDSEERLEYEEGLMTCGVCGNYGRYEVYLVCSVFYLFFFPVYRFNYRYYGLTGSMFNGARKIVVDPVIYVPTNKDHTYIYNKSCLGPLYVVVFVRLIKGNTMQIISKHFLPEVRTFKGSEIATIKNRINRSSLTQAKTSQGTVAAEYVDTEWLKSRALKMLELAGN